MAAIPVPEDLAAELAVVEAMSKADRAERDAWTQAAQMVAARRLTVATVAKIAGVSDRTAARRLAGVKSRPQAGHV